MRKPATIIAAVLIYGIFALALELHGFSWGRWAFLLGQPELDSSWIGRSRAVRADDFTVTLPTIFSQIQHEPSFPVLNSKIGMGADMRLTPCPVPLRHWTLVFKPQLWGYLFSADRGMSWHWNFYVLSLFLSTFLVLLRLNGRETVPAAWLALAFVFSPFIQFWSYLPAHFYVFGWLIFLGLEAVQGARSFLARLGAVLLISWSSVAFALWIYPPFQIPVALGIGSLCLASIWNSARDRGWLVYSKSVVPSLAVAAGLTGGVLFLFLRENRSVIQILEHTVYPGRRVSYGGSGLSPQLFFGNIVFAPMLRGLGALVGNLCEGAGFLLAFPLALAGWASGWIVPARSRVFLLALCGFAGFLIVWEVVGIPIYLSEALGLTRMVAGRNMIGYGLVEVLVVGVLVCAARDERWAKGRPLIFTAWFGLYVWSVSRLFGLIPTKEFFLVSAFSIVSFAVTSFFLAKPRWFALGYALIAVCSTWLFNPVASGGYRVLKERSDLLRAVSAVGEEDGFRSAWITLAGEPWSDLIRAVGARTLDGIFFYPQMDSWKLLDPDRKNSDIYNRYAEVTFRAGEKGHPVNFANPSPNAVVVEADLENEPFKSLPFRFLLCTPGHTPHPDSPTYRLVRNVPGKVGFSVWEKRVGSTTGVR